VSELRKDPFTGRWTIVAEGRGARPNEHASHAPTATADPNCPFCEGREDRTPPELSALRAPGLPANGPGWTARTIPNKFPSLGGPTNPEFTRPPSGGSVVEAAGQHEVVIESPQHAPGMPLLAAPARRSLFRYFRERVAAVAGSTDVAAVLLFENWGPESGGTLWHPHAQVAGFPQVPPVLAEESRRFAAEAPCLLESVTAAEIFETARVVFADAQFTAYAPFGSEHPYELRIVPHAHRASFTDASDEEVDRLAELLPRVLRALDRVVPGVSYNWWIHGAGRGVPSSFHWHVEVVPRIVRPDGFELGAGVMVNPVAPEAAARQIRAAFEDDSPTSAR
jgi:UDPglucose--hexose-1-phosphate uridylyltransferase